MTNRGSKRQLLVNMMSSLACFVMSLGISFFLTPFIVKKLGAAAYGFLGLSNNIISYTGLLTVAVNSMAGRFITIKAHEKNYSEANKYLSSIFFVNLGLAFILLILFILFTCFMNSFINVPPALYRDVQTLFILLGINSCLGLVLGVISVSTFIKNRLDLSNTRSLIGSIINTLLILLMFGLLPPRLWYYGVAGLAMLIYTIFTNYIFFKRLTPELHISTQFFSFGHIKELTMSGIWNVISRLSGLLNKGFNLLLANLFISATAMGLLSIAQTIPTLILSFFATLSGNFAPELTRLYAKGDMASLKQEFMRAIRISGFICSIPCSVFIVYGELFYRLWLPSQNANILYIISCLASFGLLIALPQEPLWTIFTITNKVKKSSLNLLYNSSITFICVLVAMFLIKDDLVRLYCLAGLSSLIGCFRVLSFLPIYGAQCLGFDKWSFYPLIFKNLLNVAIVVALSLLIRPYIISESWFGLIACSLFTSLLSIIISWYTILSNLDRHNLLISLRAKKFK